MYLATFDPPLAGGGDAQNAYGDPRVLDPENRPIPTRDGYVCISANTDAQAFALFAAIGRPELKDDARFSSVGARFKNVGEYFAIRAKGLQQKTSAEWLDIFDRMDVPAAPYHTLETLQQDPHLRDAGFFQRVEHPTEGAIWNMRPANKLSGGARSDFRAAPKLGQHTREVLSEAGYSKDEIDALISSGAARAWKGTP
jgi:crotonobetainyl-CoA:carnitine CoA-transferase CaiB-like acyl-CoA transferase